MSTLEAVLALIFAPTAVIAVVAFVLKGFFEQLLKRDLEIQRLNLNSQLANHKAMLEADLENYKAKLQNETQRNLFEHQTRFAFFYQKQASIIGELYAGLVEAADNVRDFMSPLQSGTETDEEKFKRAAISYNSFADTYRKNKIYLDENTCELLDSILEIIAGAFRKRRNFTGVPGESAHKLWREAWEDVKDKIPPVQEALTKQFRQAISKSPLDN